MVLGGGGNYITRRGPERRRVTRVQARDFFEVKVLLSQLSYEETVHRFSFKK